MVYKLKHPDPGKEGFVAGVDFCGGFGTTSSLEDAQNLMKRFGCEITTLEGKPVTVAEERMAMKIPGYKDTIPVGPPVLRAVIGEEKSQDKGAAAAAPESSPLESSKEAPKPRRGRPRK